MKRIPPPRTPDSTYERATRQNGNVHPEYHGGGQTPHMLHSHTLHLPLGALQC